MLPGTKPWKSWPKSRSGSCSCAFTLTGNDPAAIAAARVAAKTIERRFFMFNDLLRHASTARNYRESRLNPTLTGDEKTMNNPNSLFRPFREAGGSAVNVKTKDVEGIRVVRLPATVLQSV